MNKPTVLTYPQFEPNQVLTDRQLNGLRDYLDTQGRLTRAYGIGAGMVCGLHAAYQYSQTCDEHAIVITPGYGFSSDGYFIELLKPESPGEGSHGACADPIFPGLMFTHVQPYKVEARDLLSPLEKEYQSWIQPPQTISAVKTQVPPPRVWELMTTEAGIQSNAAVELKETHVDGRVLIVFLEKGKQADKPCVQTDCGKKESVTHNLRVLLVDREYISSLPACTGITQKLIHIRRLTSALTKTSSTGQNISSYSVLTDIESLNTVYGLLVEEMRDILWSSIELAYADYERYLHLMEEVDLELLKSTFHTLIEENRFDVKYDQYYYDWVRDLAAGLNEFHAAVCALTGSCKPVSGFPRHLALCAFRAEDPAQMIRLESGIRTSWHPSPVQNVMEGAWTEVRALFLRIRDMVLAFDPGFYQPITNQDNTLRPVRITPSQTPAHVLGKRAIPGYYTLNPSAAWTAFHADWQPATCCTDSVLQSYQFQLSGLTESQAGALSAVQRYPLIYGLGGYEFLRIEGHIGNQMSFAKDSIVNIRSTDNLEFDLIFVDISPLKEGESTGESLATDGTVHLRDPNFFNNLPREFNGMEHTGGVAPGGTFLVICDEVCIDKDKQLFETLAVADFSLIKSLSCCFHNQNENTGKSRSLAASPEAVPAVKLSVIPGESASGSRTVTPATGESTSRSTAPKSNKTFDKVLADRTRAYQEDLFGLNAGGAFEGVASYQSALDFVATAASLPAKLDTYAETITKLFSTAQRVKDSNKKQAYRLMMERLTHFMFDLIVVNQSQGVGTDVQTVLGDQIDRMKKSGISTSRIRTNWNSAGLAKISEAPVISVLNQLLAS